MVSLLSVKHEDKGITLYHHDKRRSGLIVQEFLGDYDGHMPCDMWSDYRRLGNAKLVRCLIHVRRKFFEATTKQADQNSLGLKGLMYCNKMFALENKWANLSPQDRQIQRQEELEPLRFEFFAWCRNQAILPDSKLEREIDHNLKYEETFNTILKDGKLVLPNNIVERTIKSFVMGRKN